MKFVHTTIKDVMIIKPVVHQDHRGFFMETWKKKVFQDAGIKYDFLQDNHSKSSQGTLRGLHYQIKYPQGKLIKILNGNIFDVAVDLRRSSSTFGKWIGEYLSHDNRKMLWIPPGFAHGFYVLSETAEIYYKCTDYYSPEHDRTLIWNDPDIAIDWPLLNGQSPLLSGKDAEGSQLKTAELYT